MDLSQTIFREQLMETLRKEFQETYGQKVEIDVSTVLKTNVEKTAIHIHFENNEKTNMQISPTMYVDDAYIMFQNGESINSIAKKYASSVMESKSEMPEVPVLTIEEALKNVFLTVVNTERNTELLENVPHQEVEDLSIVPRWRVGNGTFVVNRSVANQLMMTDDEIIRIGMNNLATEKMEIKSMAAIMREMIGQDFDGDVNELLVLDEKEPQMFVVSSEDRLFGARAIVSDAILKSVYETIGGEFYILPSSVHEVICVPCIDRDGCVADVHELQAMVREVNNTSVSPEEFLSDNVMKYDGEKLSLARDEMSVKMNDRTIRYSGMKM